MVIEWSAQAQKDLDEIWDYYSPKNLSAAIKIIRNIKSAESILYNVPLAAPVELLLEDRPEGFRKLIKGNYKIIYHIEAEAVYVSTVFDCRCDPAKLRKRVMKTEE
jgi:plasmid stabilization system protein ParE